MNGRTTAFAHDILQRRRSVVTAVPRTDFVWFRLRSSIVQNFFPRHAHSMLVLSEPRFSVNASAILRAIETAVYGFERVEMRDRFVRELLTRAERVESTREGPAAGARPPLIPGAGAAPVDRVLAARQTPRLTAGPEHSGREQVGATTAFLPAPKPQSIDVQRLTEEVVQAIDRRILAQRERLGRL